MTTDQNNQTVQDMQAELDALVRRAEGIEEEISVINHAAQEKMQSFGMGVDLSIAMFEQTFSELDSLEQEADKELDDLIKRQEQDHEDDEGDE